VQLGRRRTLELCPNHRQLLAHDWRSEQRLGPRRRQLPLFRTGGPGLQDAGLQMFHHERPQQGRLLPVQGDPRRLERPRYAP
jgi:hypothetical protein